MLSQTMKLNLIFINALVGVICKSLSQTCDKFNTIKARCYNHLTGNVISVETQYSKQTNICILITSNGQVDREFHNMRVKLKIKCEPHSIHMQDTFNSRELSFIIVSPIECYS